MAYYLREMSMNKAKWFLFFGMSFFLASFMPYLQIVHYYPEWAEHYLYIPAIGLMVLLGLLVKSLFGLRNRWVTGIFIAGYLVFFTFFCARTWETNKIYNEDAVYFDYLSKVGTRYAEFGYQNMGRIAIESGHLDKAIVPLKTAAMIQPESDCTENYIGVYYLQKEKFEEALKHFRLAAKYNELNPVYKINVSAVLIRLERYEEAIQISKKIQKDYPGYASLYIGLMVSYELSGRLEEAEKWGREGVRLTQMDETEHTTMMMSLARFAYRQGRDDLARRLLNEIAEKHGKVFWYSDAARVLLGKITISEFEGLNNKRYFDYEGMTHSYVIMALTMQKRWKEAERYIDKNKKIFDKETGRQPLLRKEMDRTREGIRLSKINASPLMQA